MKPSVSSTGSPYMDDSSEVSQSSAEPQQPVVSEFPDEGPVLAEQPFGGLVDFNRSEERRVGKECLHQTLGFPHQNHSCLSLPLDLAIDGED